MTKKLTLDLFIFVMIISAMLILFPSQKSYEICTTSNPDLNPNPNLREHVTMPKIGFFTVGDDIPVTFTIINNFTGMKYLMISERLNPYQNSDKSNVESYDNDTVEIAPNSTISFHHSFVALFPDLWTLVVSAEGFDNSTREGLVNPCYQNFTKFYVHPSSDLYIKQLSQSTNESAISSENSLNEVKQQGTYIIITTAITAVLAAATIALAISGFRQTRIMNRNVLDQRRTSRLAYGPLIWPRFRMNAIGGDPILRFENIGNGAATNVIIEMTLPTGVETINRLAFSHHLSGNIDLRTTGAGGFGVEFHNTGINLRVNPRIPTRMRYQDTTGERYDIRGTIIFENNEVRFDADT